MKLRTVESQSPDNTRPNETTLNSSTPKGISSEKFRLVLNVKLIGIKVFLNWMASGGNLGENASGILEAALELDEGGNIRKDLSELLSSDFIPKLKQKRLALVRKLVPKN